MAGRDWAELYLERHPDIILRLPEPTSMTRALGFNKSKVKRFFDELENVVSEGERRLIPETNIYNVDESGYTICHRPLKILAEKGKRSVGNITSAERGKTITAVCCMNRMNT